MAFHEACGLLTHTHDELRTRTAEKTKHYVQVVCNIISTLWPTKAITIQNVLPHPSKHISSQVV